MDNIDMGNNFRIVKDGPYGWYITFYDEMLPFTHFGSWQGAKSWLAKWGGTLNAVGEIARSKATNVH